ncbi:FAD-binding and (Fe-S)-binding domain-containing protein [Pseudolysinimonas sp.]|uniref:FAD-binding and (Fe-S)-binding domain-containing protein n=1 Tax=Pseudolysinimonas sp. TaxID=2680009 RepID=UPI00378407B2
MSRTDHSSRAGVGDQAELGRAIRAALPRDGASSVSAFDRVVAAVDASHYLLTPRAVVTPADAAEVAALFAYATAAGEAVTFRSGGTSLSGQASTSHILVDTRANFRGIEVLDDGARVRVGPGATVRQVNARLVRHGRKLGPDPASEIACTIGGVVANNSSGMACGVTQNTYQTLESAIIVLPTGTVVDSAAPDADARLQVAEPALHATLLLLRAQVLADEAAAAEVARQFAIKNTMGYSLNALLDHETPVQMLVHLLVGSEGTLGFVAEATFRTVPLHRHAATTLLVFATLADATAALVGIVATGAATVELMDAASLRAARLDPQSAGVLPAVEIDEQCALLVEYQATTADALAALVAPATELFATLPLAAAAVLSGDPGIRASLWHVRKGLYATIAGARPSGTTALLEDIAVPLPRLAETCAALTRLFEIHGYGDAVIFGHAKDGNIHFLLVEDFEVPTNVARYRAFTEDMVELVLGAGGTLKAEHGTGRIMAPFVARQYGPFLYGLMRDIKRAFDPAGILNPDTILTDDADLHLRHLKSTPTVEAEVDRCVECGYCEPVCPSKDLTTTPRQRIVVRRALADADARGDTVLAKELRREQEYAVVDTCAVDGMCQTACPVLINTGDLVRRLRSEAVGAVESAAWGVAGTAWKPVTRVASAVLSVASVLPAPVVQLPNRAARAVLGTDTVPLWSPDLPRGGAPRRPSGSATAQAVYFPACVGTMFGPAEGGEGVASALVSLAAKAGIELRQPDEIGGLCCGTPWKSKGMSGGYAAMVERTIGSLWRASDAGRLPIVSDNSSCSEGLVLALETAIEHHPDYSSLRILDAVDFAAEHLLPRVEVGERLASIVVHPTCSSTRAGSNAHLAQLAAAVATEVVIPDDWGCCAFAGDRGMLHPELTASATARESHEVETREFDAYVSCNRTCEIGMTRATGHPYQHVLEVLDRSARSPQ